MVKKGVAVVEGLFGSFGVLVGRSMGIMIREARSFIQFIQNGWSHAAGNGSASFVQTDIYFFGISKISSVPSMRIPSLRYIEPELLILLL